jgi:3-hydroxypropionate dehydrogenase (NADP+)
MDEIAKRDTILASSSSTLNMTVIQKVTNRPERCVVAHPWNPPHLMPLVEIIPGKKTSLECINRTKDFMNNLSRVPIVQKKAVPGTIGNRLAAALWREAIDLVHRGVVEVEDIDKAVSAGPGIRWAILGPHLSYHLGGGKGGIEYYLDHLGPAMERRWKSLASWTSIPPLAKSKIIQGIKDTKIVKELSIDEIKKIRDRKLIKLLKILHTNS